MFVGLVGVLVLGVGVFFFDGLVNEIVKCVGGVIVM